MAQAHPTPTEAPTTPTEAHPTTSTWTPAQKKIYDVYQTRLSKIEDSSMDPRTPVNDLRTNPGMFSADLYVILLRELIKTRQCIIFGSSVQYLVWAESQSMDPYKVQTLLEYGKSHRIPKDIDFSPPNFPIIGYGCQNQTDILFDDCGYLMAYYYRDQVPTDEEHPDLLVGYRDKNLVYHRFIGPRDPRRDFSQQPRMIVRGPEDIPHNPMTVNYDFPSMGWTHATPGWHFYGHDCFKFTYTREYLPGATIEADCVKDLRKVLSRPDYDVSHLVYTKLGFACIDQSGMTFDNVDQLKAKIINRTAKRLADPVDPQREAKFAGWTLE